MDKAGFGRILIVDDSNMARRMMAKAVGKLFPDAEILQAADAQAGLEVWQQTPPDLAVLDLNMPGMDGLAMAASIRQSDKTTTIILCTANVQQATQEQAKEMGVGFLAKPVSAEKLAAVLELAPN